MDGGCRRRRCASSMAPYIQFLAMTIVHIRSRSKRSRVVNYKKSVIKTEIGRVTA